MMFSSYETVLGLGSIFGFDIVWIIIIALSIAICGVACFICYYILHHRDNEKHLAKTINANNTIELKNIDYPSIQPTDDINTNPLGNNPTLSAVSSVVVYEKGRFEKTNVPMYYGTHVNKQQHQQQQHQPIPVNRFYPQSSAESNNSTQNSSAKSVQSQSYNNNAGHNTFHNYDPQSYPQHNNNNNYLSQQNNYYPTQQNNYINNQPVSNTNINYNNQNRQPNNTQQQHQNYNHNQPSPNRNDPSVHAYNHNQPHHHHQNPMQPQQGYSHQQYIPHNNTQPQSYPTQQNHYLTATSTIQVIKPGLKTMDSAISEATTATTATSRTSTTFDTSVGDFSEEREDSSTENKSNNYDDSEPPTPNINVNNNNLLPPMGRLQFRITVTDEANMPAIPSGGPELNDMNSGTSYASSYASSYTSASAYTDSSYPDSSNRDSQMTQSIMESMYGDDQDVIVDVAYDVNENKNNNEAPNPTLDDIIVNTDVNDINNTDIDPDLLENMNEMLEFQEINCGNDTPCSTTTMVLNDLTSITSSVASPDNDNFNKFPKTTGTLIVLNENESIMNQK